MLLDIVVRYDLGLSYAGSYTVVYTMYMRLNSFQW